MAKVWLKLFFVGMWKPLPKTRNPRRLAENFDIFDFVLSKEDAEKISALNFDYQYIVESRTCPGL